MSGRLELVEGTVPVEIWLISGTEPRPGKGEEMVCAQTYASMQISTIHDAIVRT